MGRFALFAGGAVAVGISQLIQHVSKIKRSRTIDREIYTQLPASFHTILESYPIYGDVRLHIYNFAKHGNLFHPSDDSELAKEFALAFQCAIMALEDFFQLYGPLYQDVSSLQIGDTEALTDIKTRYFLLEAPVDGDDLYDFATKQDADNALSRMKEVGLDVYDSSEYSSDVLGNFLGDIDAIKNQLKFMMTTLKNNIESKK